MVGRWHQMARDEDEALLAALGGVSMDVGRDDDGYVVVNGTKLREWDGGVRQEDEERAGNGGDAEDLSPGHPRIYSLD